MSGNSGKFRKRVVVIGAGCAGLAAARHFTAPGSPFECQVFEQNADIGGTWRLSQDVGTDNIGRPVHSSMYKHLRTNLPKEIMCYPDFPYPLEYDGVSYLTSDQFLKYIENYADHFQLHKYIKFNQCVKEVKRVIDSEGETEWEVTVFDWISKETSTYIFDAVMVANGHFTAQNHPSFEGDEIFEGKLIHSHDYRDPADFKGQRVLIIGASFSGIDVTMDVAKWASSVTLSHHLKDFAPDFPQSVRLVPDVKRFFNKGVEFENGEREQFDSVILCTGFLYNFPFMHENCQITTDGYGVDPLFKHLINIEHPSMCILCLCNFVLPCQLSDLQVRFFYNILSGNVTLPSKEEMYCDLQKDLKYRQDVLGWPTHHAHKLGPLQDALHNEMADAAEISGIKPVAMQIFHDCVNFNAKFQDLRHFRDRVFTIKNDFEYEASPPFAN